ncbi:MAG: hypothetical protein HPY82_25615 [Gammaproteobacteria bacterium]|nr:hypothetical protein [Gammaproteobacteria bacterium]
MTEYLVVSMVVVAALLLPYVNGQSPVELLVEAIKTNYSGYCQHRLKTDPLHP